MRKIVYFLLPALIASCDSVDCTLHNTVTCSAQFYAKGSKVSIDHSLSITAVGTDSVLLNQESNASRVEWPLSYWRGTDTLLFTIEQDGTALQDTLWLDKENIPHFESPDCPTKMFHQVKRVESSHHFIDSVVIVDPNVNYSHAENIQIHLYTAD